MDTEPNIFDHVTPSPEQLAQMELFRQHYKDLHALLIALPKSRHQQLAITNLEISDMWVNKAIAFIPKV